MLHLWVIALFAGLVLRDSLSAPLLDGVLSHAQVAGVTLGSMGLVGALSHLVIARCNARLHATASMRAIIVADGVVAAARWAVVAIHLAGVLVFGWLDVVRSVFGDVVVVDEIVAMTPALLVFAWNWWAFWPIERTERDATTIRRLDSGSPIYPMPRRAAFVLLNLRHHVFVWLTPLVLIRAWTEAAGWLTSSLARSDQAIFASLKGDEVRLGVNLGLEILGVFLVFFVLGPLAMRYVWDTARMPPGPLRDRLTELCRRHRVRISDVLVWRTYGTMINGAVLGLTPAFRYILLTDALLDSLPDDQVEAVMAHEVAHVRHRHIIWLALVLLATILMVGVAAEFVLRFSNIPADAELPAGVALGLTFLTFAAALGVFGVVSRRFEWQADAFAAAHMSDRLRMLEEVEGMGGDDAVTQDGAGAMARALLRVARLNRDRIERRSWRHGSIKVRVEKLERLIGVTEPRFPINSAARLIKITAMLVFVVFGALVVVQSLSGA